jgi:hypothetical protein
MSLLSGREYYAGVYWMSRRETAEECARRTARFFQLLAKCDPIFSRWFDQGWTLEEALARPLHSETDLLEEYHRYAREECPFPDKSFSLGVWNGEDNEAASSLSIHCGDASRKLTNCCILNPPKQGATSERFLQTPMLSQILRTMVLAWEPEWGVVTSGQHREQVSESAAAGTFVGWLTYFSHRRGPLPALPPPVRVEPVEDQGSLVLLTPERLGFSDPTLLQLARDVAARLSALGLLSPLRPQDP